MKPDPECKRPLTGIITLINKMDFKKLNKIEQILLKIRNVEAYKNYKFLYALQQVTHPLLEIPQRDDIHFKHSGHAGDIVYSLPAVYALSKGKNIHLHININQKGWYGKMPHPLGNTMLSENIVSMLRPLFLNQKYFKTCDIYNNQSIDFDLDKFREYPFNYRMGNIARWYFLTFGINADLCKPWLQTVIDPSVNDAIIIARSQRYRAPGIQYNFLRKYPRTIFLGIPEEYQDIKQMIPEIEYRPVKNFLEMASIIAGCKFFIGNQSLPFSIAEGLKVKRMLEVYHRSPNVIVEGANAYDFCYQPQFEKIVDYLFNEK
jgi:hypothetical protein